MRIFQGLFPWIPVVTLTFVVCICNRKPQPQISAYIITTTPKHHHDCCYFDDTYPRRFSTQLFGQSASTDELSPFYHQDRRERDNIKFLSPIKDPNGLVKLLRERYDAYSKDIVDRDYNKLRHIDEQLLRNHDVVVYNHPRIWSRLGSHSPPNAIQIQNIHKQRRTVQRSYGPNGHPYEHVGGDNGDSNDTYHSDYDCDLHISDIHSLLSQYTIYKQKCTDGNVENDRHQPSYYCEMAHATLLELGMHGVRLSDSTYQWTTHPTYDIENQPFTVDSSGIVNSPRKYVAMPLYSHASISFPNRDDRTTIDDPQPDIGNQNVTVIEQEHQQQPQPQPQPQQPQVEQLLKERCEALIREEYDLVAWLSYELYCTYHVMVYDTNQTWCYDGGDQYHSRTLNNINNSTTTNTTIAGVVPLHVSTVRHRLPVQLKPHNGIELFPSFLLFHDGKDSLKSTTQYSEYKHSFSLDGSSNSNIYSFDESHSVVQDDDDDEKQQQQQKERIRTLIQNRIQKREEGKFLEADTIRNVLWHTYNIGINDRLLQYSYGGIFDDK